VPTVNRAGKKVQRDVRSAGVSAGGQVGGGTLFTEPVLVVNQKAKLIELNAECAVYDQHGRQIGAVREFGQNIMKRAVAVRPAENRTRRLQVVDLNGRVLMALTRPAMIVRSTVIVRDPNGAEIGQIVQKNIGIIGKIRFGLESRGQSLVVQIHRSLNEPLRSLVIAAALAVDTALRQDSNTRARRR